MSTSSPPDQPPADPAPDDASGRTGWRGAIDSYGGLTVVVPIVIAIVVVGAIVFRTPLGLVSSDDPPLGDPVRLTETTHVNPGELGTPPPLTPAGGPHYATPLRQGIYEQPVPDGNAIHSLEHGMVWISYQPEGLTSETLETLEGIATEFSLDVILSPRLENGSPIIVVSWGWRLVLDEVDEQAVRDFVTTNRNRSPEPGLR